MYMRLYQLFSLPLVHFPLSLCASNAQILEFHAYDSDSDSRDLADHDFLGSSSMALGEIVSSPGSRLTRDVIIHAQKRGDMTVSAEEITQNHDLVDFQIRGKNLYKRSWFFNPDPYINIYRANGDNLWTLVKKTEVCTSSTNPSWRPFEIGMDALCRGDSDRKLKFEVIDLNMDGSFHLIGEFITTLKELTGPDSRFPSPAATFELINARKKAQKGDRYKNSGTLTFVKVAYRKRYSFLEFIHGGMDMHFTVAVDFTLSNKAPNDSRSLHHFDPLYPNQYQQVGENLNNLYYNYSGPYRPRPNT